MEVAVILAVLRSLKWRLRHSSTDFLIMTIDALIAACTYKACFRYGFYYKEVRLFEGIGGLGGPWGLRRQRGAAAPAL